MSIIAAAAHLFLSPVTYLRQTLNHSVPTGDCVGYSYFFLSIIVLLKKFNSMLHKCQST
jgi:hypothetical protein